MSRCGGIVDLGEFFFGAWSEGTVLTSRRQKIGNVETRDEKLE